MKLALLLFFVHLTLVGQSEERLLGWIIRTNPPIRQPHSLQQTILIDSILIQLGRLRSAFTFNRTAWCALQEHRQNYRHLWSLKQPTSQPLLWNRFLHTFELILGYPLTDAALSANSHGRVIVGWREISSLILTTTIAHQCFADTEFWYWERICTHAETDTETTNYGSDKEDWDYKHSRSSTVMVVFVYSSTRRKP